MTGHAQVQHQTTILKTFQPSFKVSVVVDRLPGSQLHAAAGKTAEVGGLDQLPIQPRRRNFQCVRPWHDVFNIENRAKLPAEIRTVFVRDPGQWISSGQSLIQKHPQHARFATAEDLDLYYFETAGGGYPLRNFPHTFDVKRHESNDLLADGRNTGRGPTKKWACAHWCASPKAGTQQFSVT